MCAAPVVVSGWSEVPYCIFVLRFHFSSLPPSLVTHLVLTACYVGSLWIAFSPQQLSGGDLKGFSVDMRGFKKLLTHFCWISLFALSPGLTDSVSCSSLKPHSQ